MDLHSGTPYWLLRDGLGLVVPPLAGDLECDVAIIGGGISGALVADRAAREGMRVAVLDRHDLGQGSTVASTALLQYDVDVPLHELRTLVPKHHADRAFVMGVETIGELESLCTQLRCPFERRNSLYFAREEKDVQALHKECDARREIGLEVEFVSRERLLENHGVAAAGAIRSTQAAECDPYQLCHALLKRAIANGAAVHDRTRARSLECAQNGVVLQTDRGAVVRAKHVIHASGYEAVTKLPKGLVELQSTYAVASEPVETGSTKEWADRSLLWEFAETYIYARWCDGRVFIGGEDEPYVDGPKRDKLIESKAGTLVKKLAEIVPSLKLEGAFAWTGTFATTKDGLGYIGAMKDGSPELWALGFGGNGITFSAIAAKILTDRLMGRENSDSAVFAFDRR